MSDRCRRAGRASAAIRSTPTAGPQDLRRSRVALVAAHRWTRYRPLSISGNGNIGVTATTTNGCNMFVFDPRQGRKNYYKRLQDGAATNTLLVDQYDQPYIGEKGLFIAFQRGGAIRWRVPTIGVPRSARFADRGVAGPPRKGRCCCSIRRPVIWWRRAAVAEDVNLDDPGFGYGDCITDGPVPGPLAARGGCEPPGPISTSGLPVRRVETDRAGLRMQDRERSIHQVWSAAIPGGMIGPPTLSADGSRVYAVSNRAPCWPSTLQPARPCGHTISVSTDSRRSQCPREV